MISEEKLKEIQKLVEGNVKNITYEGNMTIIEFDDGRILPLYGGVAGIEGTKMRIYTCSFCGQEGKKEKPVVSLNDKNDPLICPDCATTVIQLFIENGVEIELDLSNVVSKELIEKILDQKQ